MVSFLVNSFLFLVIAGCMLVFYIIKSIYNHFYDQWLEKEAAKMRAERKAEEEREWAETRKEIDEWWEKEYMGF